MQNTHTLYQDPPSFRFTFADYQLEGPEILPVESYDWKVLVHDWKM